MKGAELVRIHKLGRDVVSANSTDCWRSDRDPCLVRSDGSRCPCSLLRATNMVHGSLFSVGGRGKGGEGRYVGGLLCERIFGWIFR